MPIHNWMKVEAGVFHYLHLRWIGTICDSLNDGRLPSDYYAIGENRTRGLAFEPDVMALHRGDADSDLSSNGTGKSVGLLTAQPKATVMAESDLDAYRRKQNRIAVRTASGDHLVAVLEIVSSGNKSSRKAIRDFVDKAEAFLERDIHFMFVDLYPYGSLDPCGLHGMMWEEMTGQDFVPPEDMPLCAASYQANGLLRVFVEPLAVGMALPSMPLYIESDAYVSVPLEMTYQTALAAIPQHIRNSLPGGGSC